MQAEPQTKRDTTYDTRAARFTSANLQTEDTAFGPDRTLQRSESREQEREGHENRDEKRETRDLRKRMG